MAEHVFDSVTDAINSTATVPAGDVVRVLGYAGAGDGGAAYWVPVTSQPSHGAKFQRTGGGASQWFELAAGQIVSVAMLGAKGDSDASGSSGTDDEAAIVAALSFANEVYCPPGETGFYSVGTLSNYGKPGKRLWGPGIVIPTGYLDIPNLGDIVTAGVKHGASGPTHARGGFLVGGSTATPEGLFLKAQREGIMDVIPSRLGSPIEVQVYTNLVHGYGVLSAVAGLGNPLENLYVEGLNTRFFDSGRWRVHENDMIWIGPEKFRVAEINIDTPDNPTVKLKSYPAGNALTTSTDPTTGPKVMYWTGYRTNEYIGTYDHTTATFTREAGDPIFKRPTGTQGEWHGGVDANLILDGSRYEIAKITVVSSKEVIHLVSGPGAISGSLTVLHREWSPEEYCALFRVQGAWGAKEHQISYFARPDFAGMRIDATPADLQYEYFLPYHMMGQEVSDHPDYPKEALVKETNMLGEGFTYMTFKDGHVGIHERDPKCALHVTRHYAGTQGAYDTSPIEKIIAQFRAGYSPGGTGTDETSGNNDSRKLAIISRNNWRAPAIQGYDQGTFPLQICIQPEPETGGGSPKSRCHFGDWAAVPDPFRFQFTGDVKFSNNISADGVYATTTASAANVFVGSDGQLKRSTSSILYKQGVEALSEEDAGRVWDLNPVSYRSAVPGEDPSVVHVGLIAEEVAAVDPRLVHWREDEQHERQAEGVQYDRVCVLLLAELKKERAERQDAMERIRALEERMAAIGGAG